MWLLLAATLTTPTTTPCGVDTNETTAAKVERLRAELDVALTQLRLERAAEKVNRAIERRKAKR